MNKQDNANDGVRKIYQGNSTRARHKVARLLIATFAFLRHDLSKMETL